MVQELFTLVSLRVLGFRVIVDHRFLERFIVVQLFKSCLEHLVEWYDSVVEWYDSVGVCAPGIRTYLLTCERL